MMENTSIEKYISGDMWNYLPAFYHIFVTETPQICTRDPLQVYLIIPLGPAIALKIDLNGMFIKATRRLLHLQISKNTV